MDKMNKKDFYIKKQKRRKKNTIIACAVVVAIGGIFTIHKAFSKKTALNSNDGKSVTESKQEIKQKVIGPNDIVPGENIIKSAEAYAVPANEVYDMINTTKVVKYPKSVFLTFDDGPSENTEQILKILKDEGVHATFFVVGSQLEKSDANKQELKAEIESGNAIGNHSYSHNYSILYPGNSVNPTKFMDEFNRTNELMKSVLGNDFDSRVLRMPGGYLSRKYYKDPHLKELDKDFAENNIVSIDWDAETGDATGKRLDVQQMVNNVAKYAKTEKHMILLMHDAGAKKETVKALPSIINYLKSQGYEFRVISNSVKEKNDVNKVDTANNNSSVNK